MSNWLVAVLFGVGLLSVAGWADEEPTPPASGKPEAKGKDKKGQESDKMMDVSLDLGGQLVSESCKK